MADDPNQDADGQARNQAALEAYDREQQFRARHAAFLKRNENSPGNAEQDPPQGRGGGWQPPFNRFGAPPAQPQMLDAAGDLGPPQPPQFATDTAAALTAATQAMAAIVESPGNRSNTRLF